MIAQRLRIYDIEYKARYIVWVTFAHYQKLIDGIYATSIVGTVVWQCRVQPSGGCQHARTTVTV